MAVRIRLKRMGAKKRPFYKLVVSDSRKSRNSNFLDVVGYYRPLDNPVTVKMDEEKVLHWLDRGAEPSGTVKTLLSQSGIWQKYLSLRERPGKRVHDIKEGGDKESHENAGGISSKSTGR